MSGLEISIDRDQCMGSGNCTFTAAGVFGLDDDGVAVVLDPQAQPEETIVLAARNCPTQAITISRADAPVASDDDAIRGCRVSGPGRPDSEPRRPRCRPLRSDPARCSVRRVPHGCSGDRG